MKSPGRKAMAKECAPKRVKRDRWTYKGKVPQAIEEDRAFYLLFCESKELEAAIHNGGDVRELAKKQARFINVQEAMRRRWIEVMEPPAPKPLHPAERLRALLKDPKPLETPDA